MIRDVRQARHWNCTYYYTGRRCKNGHLSPRFTSNKACVACETVRRTILTPEARDYLTEKRRQHDQARKNKKREYARLWYRKNKERLKKRRQAHPNYKRRMRSANEQYRKAKRNAYIYTHDIEIQRRIDTIYDEMRQLNEAGGDYVVDHIIPIQNELVCGGHITRYAPTDASSASCIAVMISVCSASISESKFLASWRSLTSRST